MHILSPETDNCPSWISGRERMTVENISWSISTKECCRPRRDRTRDLLVSSRTAHSTEPPRPARKEVNIDNFLVEKEPYLELWAFMCRCVCVNFIKVIVKSYEDNNLSQKPKLSLISESFPILSYNNKCNHGVFICSNKLLQSFIAQNVYEIWICTT